MTNWCTFRVDLIHLHFIDNKNEYKLMVKRVNEQFNEVHEFNLIYFQVTADTLLFY